MVKQVAFLARCDSIVGWNNWPGNTKRGSITVQLTSCLTGLDWPVSQIKTKIVSCHTTNSKPVKQEVNGTVILPPLVFPGLGDNLTSDGLNPAATATG